MKTDDAIKALKRGKRITSVAPDPPVNLCDYQGYNDSCGFYELCQQDVVVKLIPVSTCSAKVKRIYSLKDFEYRCSMPYLNFEEC